jgi:uncharacterized protein
MNNRIAGFDLARAYAIMGMYIVNFNTVFGSHTDKTLLGKFLTLFNGNSSTIFVILAGMGVSLMSNRQVYSIPEKSKLRNIVMKRSWFLFFIGLILYTWWPADILHFYGGYMHIAALMLFVNKKYFLQGAAIAVVLFHLLLLFIPYENGWNFETLQYSDFWTAKGFLRNTIYNGWNPVLPWIAFFFFGMWFGRLDWKKFVVRKNVFLTGLIIYVLLQILLFCAGRNMFHKDITFYIEADYLPPFLPFMLGTASFSMMVIVVCIYIGHRFDGSSLLKLFTVTGQHTLTHYILHLTIGMIVLALISGKSYTGTITTAEHLSPLLILFFAMIYFLLSLFFSKWWSQKFKYGPLETLMRKISG